MGEGDGLMWDQPGGVRGREEGTHVSVPGGSLPGGAFWCFLSVTCCASWRGGSLVGRVTWTRGAGLSVGLWRGGKAHLGEGEGRDTALGASRGYWGLSCRPVSMMHQQAASSHYNSAQGGTQHYQGQSSIAMMGPSGQGGSVMGQRPMAPYRPSQQGRPMCPVHIRARGLGVRLCASLPIA